MRLYWFYKVVKIINNKDKKKFDCTLFKWKGDFWVKISYDGNIHCKKIGKKITTIR